MCGRYNFLATPQEVAEFFELVEVPELPQRYNIAPSQLVAVVGEKPNGGGRGLVRMQWGFVPRWARDPDEGPKPINVRSETVRTNKAFRESFRDRRCLIPASGFYEWKQAGRTKQPFHFRPSDGNFLAFAGIWDVWSGGQSMLYTCAILTVPANTVMREFHERMPAILGPDQFSTWLNPSADLDAIHAMLQPVADDFLVPMPVSPAVNKVSNDGPECLTPAPEERTLF